MFEDNNNVQVPQNMLPLGWCYDLLTIDPGGEVQLLFDSDHNSETLALLQSLSPQTSRLASAYPPANASKFRWPV